MQSRHIPRRLCRRSNRARHGVTTVETALVISLLFAIMFAGIEVSRVNVIRNTIENAAYEGARQGILPGATTSECIAAAQNYLDVIGINTSTISTSPAALDDTVENISVTVSVTMDGTNGYVMPTFFFGDTLSATITLPRET